MTFDCIACGSQTTKTFTIACDDVETGERWTASGLPFCDSCRADSALLQRVCDVLYRRRNHNATEG